MTGMIDTSKALVGVRELNCDAVVCGGGAGGSMAARELARAGLRVVVLEQGDDHTPDKFTQREDEMIPQLFADMGGQRSEDLGVLILSGRGLGGSTIHNTNLCKRTHPGILERWRKEHGVDVSPESMAPFFDIIERDLHVNAISEYRLNAANLRLKRGVKALGYRGGMLSHNRDEKCVGSGFCELGCAYDGKMNARRVLIPDAVAAGARVYTNVRVARILHDGKRTTGVEAEIDTNGKAHSQRVVVRAKIVCLAGSAIGSAALALRSDLPDPHEQIGQALRIHPGAAIAGIFDERVDAWRGIPQSYECTEFLNLDYQPENRDQKRVWIVPSFAHPVGAAALMPGFGPALMGQMRRYANVVALAAMVHDETEGQVRIDAFGRTRIRYLPAASDREQLALGSKGAARLLLAAGAREVLIPANPTIRIRNERDIELITEARFSRHDAKLTAVHPMGTMRMGEDPKNSAVDTHGKYHHLRGLHVVDGSLFPTSIGGPPQMSVYAFAMRTAKFILSEK